MDTRLKVGERLATDFKPANLEEFIQQEVTYTDKIRKYFACGKGR